MTENVAPEPVPVNAPVNIYTTCKDKDEAMSIAHALIEERLVACCNITEGVSSIFRWEGEVEEATEASLLAKTRLGRVDDALRMIEKLHSYDTPIIEVVPLIAANNAHKNFIVTQTSEE